MQTNDLIVFDKEFVPDKKFFLELLDEEISQNEENLRLENTIFKLGAQKLSLLLEQNKKDGEAIIKLESGRNFDAENYNQVARLKREISQRAAQISLARRMIAEPYFARMDLFDNFGKLAKLYIGKKGDRPLGIMDWRAPVAKRYYQKSSFNFAHNVFEYKVILRRAFNIDNGKLTAWKNEYLNVRDFLTKEEIASRDESLVFDPFLKEILRKRKKSAELTDIIETIQEKQYEIITLDKSSNLILQGCAGSGKTMIMLHRLSYILYNNSDIKPENILVLAPSSSFNEFIEKLCGILEIDKVKTQTAHSYYKHLLLARGIKIKVDKAYKESEKYLSYIYSENFVNDAREEIDSIVGTVKDFFMCDEFAAIKENIKSSYKQQSAQYSAIKNAPKYIIKSVLGEIKFTKEKGVYYTREFRRLMSEAGVVLDFLSLDLAEERFKNHYYFFLRYTEFFESFKYVIKNLESVYQLATAEIEKLEKELNEQLDKLTKHKNSGAFKNGYPFEDKINQLTKMLLEYKGAKDGVDIIYSGFGTFFDLLEIIKNQSLFLHLGNAEKDEGLARFLYSEIIRAKKIKLKTRLKMYQSDYYAIARLLYMFGADIKLGQSYIFIDEGQDLSLQEYKLIREVNDTAAINIFGDTAQNISKTKGISSWDVLLGFNMFYLNQNYRNTNQIVKFVEDELNIKMQAIGFDGPQVEFCKTPDVLSVLQNTQGLSAVIAPQEILQKISKLFGARLFNKVSEKGILSKTKINLMTVEESKGLEFSAVIVYNCSYNVSEKYIAYTRALNKLIILED